nr:hypothetical protein [Nitrospinaceae bacterium]
ADVGLPDGVRLNEAVVRAGYAWHYRVNHPPDRRLARLEYEAWRLSRGLWLQLDPRPPWEFRRERKVPDAPKKPAQADYDRIFHYGIVGDPRTQRFFWPACGPYPKGVRGFWIFRSRLDAETFGFRKAPGCPGE